MTKSLTILVSLSLSIAALIIFVGSQTGSPRPVEAMPFNKARLLHTDKNTSVEQLIGYRHKGVTRGKRLPNGAKDLGGGLLSAEDYGVSRFSMGSTFMLWFEKIIDRDETGVPDWEVKDVLIFEKLKKNQVFLFSHSSTCSIDGNEDLDMIVMAEEQTKKRAYRILKAWRANVETEKFEELAASSIACKYEAPQIPQIKTVK